MTIERIVGHWGMNQADESDEWRNGEMKNECNTCFLHDVKEAFGELEDSRFERIELWLPANEHSDEIFIFLKSFLHNMQTNGGEVRHPFLVTS